MSARWSSGVTVVVAVLTINLSFGSSQMHQMMESTHLGVFGQMMTTPLMLVLPALAVALGSRSLFTELGTRFVANTRARASIRLYLAAKVAAGVSVAFMGFALIAFGGFAMAYWVWPALGDLHVEASNGYMTPEQAAEEAIGTTTFSQLLAISDLAFGLGYSLWFGICGATYALFANALLLVIHNRAVAVGLPLAVYLAHTVLVALVGDVRTGLMYSAVPWGLEQTDILPVASSTLELAALALAVLGITLWRAPRLRRLR